MQVEHLSSGDPFSAEYIHLLYLAFLKRQKGQLKHLKYLHKFKTCLLALRI